MVKRDFTARIGQDGDWWIGWIEEVPGVNCQEKTREELLATLQTTLREMLEPESPIEENSEFEKELISI